MSDISRFEQLEKALSIQQILFRTLVLMFIENRLSPLSSADERDHAFRDLIDRWHEMIDYDATTSQTAPEVQESDREDARQYVDRLASELAKAWELRPK